MCFPYLAQESRSLKCLPSNFPWLRLPAHWTRGFCNQAAFTAASKIIAKRDQSAQHITRHCVSNKEVIVPEPSKSIHDVFQIAPKVLRHQHQLFERSCPHKVPGSYGLEFQLLEHLGKFCWEEFTFQWCNALSLSWWNTWGNGIFPHSDPWGVRFNSDYYPDRLALAGTRISPGNMIAVLEGIQADQDYLRVMFNLERGANRQMVCYYCNAIQWISNKIDHAYNRAEFLYTNFGPQEASTEKLTIRYRTPRPCFIKLDVYHCFPTWVLCDNSLPWNSINNKLLMEEILHWLGCEKPCIAG